MSEWQTDSDVMQLLRLIPRPLFVVRTPCLRYILFRYDPAVGLVKFDCIDRATVKAMGYVVYDLNRPDSERERLSMLEREDEHYRPLYANADQPQDSIPQGDGGLFVVQSGDDQFAFFRMDGDQIQALPVTAAACGKRTVFDVRRPASDAQHKERHARWCSEGGKYVLVFNRRAEIQGE